MNLQCWTIREAGMTGLWIQHVTTAVRQKRAPCLSTLHMVSAISAAVDQPRRRQISKRARQMRGAFWLTYIMSAVSEKLSMRARVT
jgi:hypothetical protein